MLKGKKALLLDMNNTFMFGEDRFGENEDYSIHYKAISGDLSRVEINELIAKVFKYLNDRYSAEEYRHSFPSLEETVIKLTQNSLSQAAVNKVVETFSFHEHGHIPQEYVNALKTLKEKYILALVVDIWSPKEMWINTFKELGINNLFSASSFSSDHGIVKPSPKPFEMVINELTIPKQECLVIGDSIRRDLGGAVSAGVDCVLVGAAHDTKAIDHYSSLLEFCNTIL